MTGGKSGKRDIKKATTGEKTSMVFKLTQIKRIMKEMTNMRISKDSQVAISCALSYIIMEILDGSKNIAMSEGKKKIIPKHIANAIVADSELGALLHDCKIQSGGCRSFALPEVTRRN